MLVTEDIIGRYELARSAVLVAGLSATEDAAGPETCKLEDFQDRLLVRL